VVGEVKMYTQAQLVDILNTVIPNASALRKEYPGLADILEGQLNGKPNIYEQDGCFVVSRTLAVPGMEKPSTVGIVGPGTFAFGTKRRETLTVLTGVLNAWVNDGERSRLAKYGSIIAPRETTLHLSADSIALYVCQYSQIPPLTSGGRD
jgi:uncharacterized protein YaiE (UPF0345 family)